MRARHRQILASLVAAIAVAIAPLAVPSAPANYQAATCPGSTAWDNLLQRCV